MTKNQKEPVVTISDNVDLHIEMGAESALCYLQIASKMLTELVLIAGVADGASEEQRKKASVAHERIAMLETMVITPIANSIKVLY